MGIKYTSNDSYFFMRLVDNLLHNFPTHTGADPYLIYPSGTGLIETNFFIWLLAVPAWIIGLGSPSQHTIDVVGVFLPAILGALTVVPVYFIGKMLFNRGAGILAAALIAILPGEFLGRSILGFTDNHVVESLFTLVSMLFLMLAVRTAGQRELKLSHFKNRDWAVLKRPLAYTLLAALFMGLYIYSWLGALLFIFVTFLFFVLQFVIDHLKRRSTAYLASVGFIFYFVVLVMSWLGGSREIYLASLFIATLAMPALSYISMWMTRKKLAPVVFPLAIIGMAAVAFGLIYLVRYDLFITMVNALAVFKPSGASLTTIEMQPLISRQYGNPFAIASGNFPGLISADSDVSSLNARNIFSFLSTTLFLGFASLVYLIYNIFKRGNAGNTLLVIWSLVVLLATIGQRRFGYYLAVNVALLIGAFGWVVFEFIKKRSRAWRERIILALWILTVVMLVGVWLDNPNKRDLGYYPYAILANVVLIFMYWFYKIFRPTPQIAQNTRRRTGARTVDDNIGSQPAVSRLGIVVLLIVLVQVVFSPNVFLQTPKQSPAYIVASSAPYAASDGWVSSLDWMKENTPEPMGDSNAYYGKYPALADGVDFPYPQTAYGVLSWWDYGYWITRIAHRIPNANPSQDPNAIKDVAAFFTALDEQSTSDIRQKLGSAYVVVDHETALTKLWAIITWAEKNPGDYFDQYLVPQEDGKTLKPTLLYYPDFYRSMAVRLFCFDGLEQPGDKPIVISYRTSNNLDATGNLYKIINSAQQFDTLQQAEAFTANQTSGDTYRIVGVNPLKTVVPLEALEHYKLIHGSPTTINVQDVGAVPQVKIFEYVK